MMSGATYLAKSLATCDVSHVFMVPSVLRHNPAAMIARVDSTAGARRKAWTAWASEQVSNWRAKYANLIEADTVPVRPERIRKEFSEHPPEDALIVVDCVSDIEAMAPLAWSPP